MYIDQDQTTEKILSNLRNTSILPVFLSDLLVLTSLVQPFPKQALVFACLQYTYFEYTVGKGEIACNEQFLLFPQRILSVGELSTIFINFEIVVC